jgi:hypothetical protein
MPKSEWKAVKDNAPRYLTDVLCYEPGSTLSGLYIGNFSERGWNSCDCLIDPAPTHWMAMPEPPK